jgi:hypothetical protein
MKTLVKKLTKFLATSALVLSAYADADTTSLTFGVGYRQDDVNWKIDTPDTVLPEGKSHLDFRDLDIIFIGTKLRAIYGCECPLYFRTSFDYGWVLDGRLRENDKFYSDLASTTFDGGGVTNTAGYTQVIVHNDVSRRSHVWDFDIALGMPLDTCWFDNITLIPTVGFNYDRSFYRVNDSQLITDGLTTEQAIALGISTDDLGTSSSYKTSWWGPWLGLDFVYCQQDCWNLYGEFSFHFLRVRRERDSNTGFAYFDNYERTKSGYGVSFKLGSNYVFCENWFLDGSIAWLDYWSGWHRDSIYWKSGSIRLDLGYLF